MNVILKQDVAKLGFKNEIVSVKNGYGRNFLIPKGLAILATKSEIKVLAEQLIPTTLHNMLNPSPQIVGLPAFAPAFQEYPEFTPIRKLLISRAGYKNLIPEKIKSSSLEYLTDLPKSLGMR